MNMTKTLPLATVLFSAAAVAQAPVPITEEPHHHLKLQNPYVRVFYVEVPPRKATLAHAHERPYLYVALGDAKILNKTLGGDEKEVTLKDGDYKESPGKFAHIATNQLDTPFRNVTVEFMGPDHQPAKPMSLAPNEKLDLPISQPDTLIIALEHATLQITQPGKPRTTLRSGDSAWLARGSGGATIRNPDNSAARLLSLEFQPGAAGTK